MSRGCGDKAVFDMKALIQRVSKASVSGKIIYKLDLYVNMFIDESVKMISPVCKKKFMMYWEINVISNTCNLCVIQIDKK